MEGNPLLFILVWRAFIHWPVTLALVFTAGLLVGYCIFSS